MKNAMAATSRMLRTSNPLRPNFFPSSSSTSSITWLFSVRCFNEMSRNGEKKKMTMMRASGNVEMKSRIAVMAGSVAAASEGVTTMTTPPQTETNAVDLVAVLTSRVSNAVLRILRPKKLVKRSKSSWKRQAEMLIERGVVDCRFFTLFAVAGSLLGSILCFFEGCFLILESYFEYFQEISQRSDEGHLMQLLIEAMDVFLMGGALLIFGTGLYALFVNQRYLKDEDRGLFPSSNLFGLFHLKTLPTWVEMQCISQAKTKIGHAVLMILQVGILDKFKNVPLVTGFDLACFAGAVLISSACIFFLSKLAMGGAECGR